jgi:diguanylate cyclase (GGDEF)-like protein
MSIGSYFEGENALRREVLRRCKRFFAPSARKTWNHRPSMPYSADLFHLVLLSSLTPILLWALAIWVFRLSPRAARYWLWSALLGACGLSLLPLQQHWSEASALAAPLFLAAILLGRGGIQIFGRLPMTHRQHGAVMALGLVSAGLCGAAAPWRGMAWAGFAACGAWTLWASAREISFLGAKEFELRQTQCVVKAFRFLAASMMIPGFFAWIADALWGNAPDAWNEAMLDISLVFFTGLHVLLGALILLRLLNKLRHLSRHDVLTDLLNRRALEEALAQERLRHLRADQPYTVVMLDIDHFKRINEAYGHAAGDAVLIALAGSLKHTAREVDVVARTGGEEFCLLLPNTGIAGALQVAERIRMAVERRPVRWHHTAMAFTVSLGVAEVLPGGELVPSILARTERALLRAKNQGRNCAVVAVVDQELQEDSGKKSG